MKKNNQLANLRLYRTTKKRRLNTKGAIYTPHSQTTVMINYSERFRVLEIKFANGRIYHYLQVHPLVWEEYKWVLKSGGSSGRFVTKNVQDVFQFEIVD